MMSESAISKRMLTQTGQKIILNFQVAIRVAHSNGAWTSSKYDSSAIAWRTSERSCGLRASLLSDTRKNAGMGFPSTSSSMSGEKWLRKSASAESALTNDTDSTWRVCISRVWIAATESAGTFSFKKASMTYRDFSAERSLNETPKAVKDAAKRSEHKKIVKRDGRITVRCCFHPRKDSDIK